jgi:hypothetical protein
MLTTNRHRDRRPGNRLRLVAALFLAAPLITGCASWRPVERYEGWTLYVQDGAGVDPDVFRTTFEPALEAVEACLGPFEGHVDVHAWEGGVQPDGAQRGEIRHGEEDIVQDVPGIGPAKVRAFHSRGGGGPFSPSGIFLGTSDTGTAVHELVHARIAEERDAPPMWLEEGLAMLLGDGFFTGEEWVVDGLSYWPLRELREARLSNAEIARLLAIRAQTDLDMRDNVLVHFVGWAIAFDLYRETNAHLQENVDWREWLTRLQNETTSETIHRLHRTIEAGTEDVWMQRLDHADANVRMAAAKGLWKLRSRDVIERMLDRIEQEEDDTVRVGLAVNLLAGAGEVRMGRSTWRRTWRAVMPVLSEAKMENAAEERAIRDLYAWYRSWRGRRGRTRPSESMEVLARFWEE